MCKSVVLFKSVPYTELQGCLFGSFLVFGMVEQLALKYAKFTCPCVLYTRVFIILTRLFQR